MKDKDDRLIIQAIEQRWNIPKEFKAGMIRRLMQIIADPTSSNREVTAASRAIISAESQNQTDAHKDDERATIDEGRNRFLEIANRLGIRTNLEPVAEEPAGDGDSLADHTGTQHLEDGRERDSGGEDGEQEGEG